MATAVAQRPRRRRAATFAIRLADVARAAEVSTATASRALASPDLVSAALRERVGAAAARLGYAPNYAARALASRRSRLIGAIVNAADDPLLGPVLAALECRLANEGQAFVLTTTDETRRAGVCARTLVSLGVDALILFGVTSSPELEQWRSAHGRPWFFVNAPGVHSALLLNSTKQRGMVLAARYLQQLGHRRLLVLSDEAAGLAELVRTELGSAEARLTAHNCAGARRECELSARTVLRDALSSPAAPTAVVCSSDALGALAIRECATRAVRVPDQVSTVGLGDTNLARILWPALTTVRIPLEEIGRGFADAVIAKLNGRPLPLTEFPVRLVLRESSGPPPR